MASTQKFIPIPRSVTDIFYRYKMHDLIIKHEGKGNGVKTVLSNLDLVAKDLGRPPELLIKYLGIHLGTQTIIDPTSNKYLVKGTHPKENLMILLDAFISQYILCQTCGNPETLLKTRHNHIVLKCEACGYHSLIPNQNKMDQFIIHTTKKHLKQTPEAEPVDVPEVSQVETSEKQEWSVDVSTEAVAQRKKNMCSGLSAEFIQ